jgi:NAD(P)-dependent dehydrogenase (short-subunit alcohol dehydrogenase family)
VTVLIERADVVVFAGAREPGSATELQALAKAHPAKLHVVKLTSADEADNRAAAAEIKRVAGRLDVVIANAGMWPLQRGARAR